MVTNPLVMHLPRLPKDRYQGHAFVHWSMTMEDRAAGWLTPAFHESFRTHLGYVSTERKLICPAYCLMPDHLHLLWLGLAPGCDQTLAVRQLRRGLNDELKPLKFQKQPYDHVLREAERQRGAFQATAFYILANTVRAGLTERMEGWPYSGGFIIGQPKVNAYDTDYWELFWTCYAQQRTDA